jgi:hypothetical protein
LRRGRVLSHVARTDSRKPLTERVNALFVQHFDFEEELSRRITAPEEPPKNISPALVHHVMIARELS